MTISSTAKNFYMRAKGYTPIELNDTKNVLKGIQKYKYVKRRFITRGKIYIPTETTLLPSGTIVEFKYPFNCISKSKEQNFGEYFEKTVFKKAAKNIYSYIFANLEAVKGKLKFVGGSRGYSTKPYNVEDNILPGTSKALTKK